MVVYADDILLLAPTRGAMQLMLDTCEDYAARHNIMFSTDTNPSKSKTKCIFVTGPKRNLSKPAPLTLCGRDLPWVSTATHLGHELHESGLMEYDAGIKKAIFVKQSVEVREAFGFAIPIDIVSAMKVYCSSFYECMLWLWGCGTSVERRQVRCAIFEPLQSSLYGGCPEPQDHIRFSKSWTWCSFH